MIKSSFFIKLFDSITQFFYLPVFVAHWLKTKPITLIQFSWVEEKVVNVFHFDFIDFLFSHLIGPFLKLLHSKGRSNVVSQVDVTALLQLFEIADNGLIDKLNSVHHDDYSNIVRVKAFVSNQISNVFGYPCKGIFKHVLGLTVHANANEKLNAFSPLH